VAAPAEDTSVATSEPVIVEDVPRKKRKRDQVQVSDGFVRWCDISGVEDSLQESGGDDNRINEESESYIPSKSSLMEAAEEHGSSSTDYIEFENGHSEESAPLSEDVDDVPVNLAEGFILMDVAILLGVLGKFCLKCKDTVSQVTQTKSGAMVTFTILCCRGHRKIVRSQNMVQYQAEGNVLLANAILSSGMTFAIWQRFCIALKIPSISNTTYYSLVGKYIKPVVFGIWYSARQATLAAVKAGNNLCTWVADGQFDSAGYCAKYLIETVMCASSGKIIDFLIFQKGIDKGEMESKGLRILLNRLVHDVGGKIKTLCSDRNPSVQKMMRLEFPQIDHQYDVWHVAKGLKKKMKKNFASSKNLISWSKSISNHLWWCSQTCGGCSATLLQKWNNLLQHLTNKHSNCEHEELAPEQSRKKAWICEQSEVKKLRSLITDTRFNNDLKKCTQFVHTGNLESLHSKANIYRPKKYHFSYEGMVLRTCIAYIDHNANLNKKMVSQVVKNLLYSKLQLNKIYLFQVSEFSKETGEWMLRKVYERNNYDWLREMTQQVKLNLRTREKKITDEMRAVLTPFNLPQNIAPLPKKTKEDLNAAISRFAQ
jgi:hypothetical protein